MGPLPRGLAADAHGCIMVRMTGDESSIIPHRIQGCGAMVATHGRLASDCVLVVQVSISWRRLSLWAARWVFKACGNLQ